MPGPGKYRQNAEDLIEQASAIRGGVERKMLLQIAGQYRRLANYKEKGKHLREPHSENVPPVLNKKAAPEG